MAKFVESKYGNPMLLDKGGHVYKSSVKRGRKIYWTCREKNKKCLSKGGLISKKFSLWLKSPKIEGKSILSALSQLKRRC